MNFLNKLEKKYRKYAIPNLMYYIVMLYGAGLVIQLFAPMAYWRFLSLDIGALMHGQIWRLVTFIIYPPTMGTFVFDSVFFGIISLFLYWPTTYFIFGRPPYRNQHMKSVVSKLPRIYSFDFCTAVNFSATVPP